jgi:hypothetical protein
MSLFPKAESELLVVSEMARASINIGKANATRLKRFETRIVSSQVGACETWDRKDEASCPVYDLEFESRKMKQLRNSACPVRKNPSKSGSRPSLI